MVNVKHGRTIEFVQKRIERKLMLKNPTMYRFFCLNEGICSISEIIQLVRMNEISLGSFDFHTLIQNCHGSHKSSPFILPITNFVATGYIIRIDAEINFIGSQLMLKKKPE